MYEKYHTDALVVGARERGESDRAIALYTRDFGLVWARATGVRKEASKMRGAVQHCAHARVSLVKGKSSWRLVGAQAFPALTVGAASVFARIGALVLRLIHGEESHLYLFDTLTEAHTALLQNDEKDFPTIELLCVARVLFALGYLPKIALEESQREHLLKEVNKALEGTHL